MTAAAPAKPLTPPAAATGKPAAKPAAPASGTGTALKIPAEAPHTGAPIAATPAAASPQTSTAPATATTTTSIDKPKPLPVDATTAASAASPSSTASVDVAAAAPAEPAPAKPRAASAASAADKTPVLSEAERRQLAALPLPKLPTLVAREDSRMPEPVAAPAPAPARSAAPAAKAAALPAADELAAARKALAQAGDRTGLGEAQLARLRSLQQQLDGGDAGATLQQALAFDRELDAAHDSYTVGTNETVRQIAAKEQFYGNASLWPLIWRANAEAVKNPAVLKRGQTLKIPKHPRLQDVSNALAYAQTHAPDGRRLGDRAPD